MFKIISPIFQSKYVYGNHIIDIYKLINMKFYPNLSIFKNYRKYSTTITSKHLENCCKTHSKHKTAFCGPCISKSKELTIPLPYGNIAAKAWGRESGHPTLALHGWLDNSGTFDKLLPLLLDEFYVVAIDAPGHGMSAHKPPGCIYRDIDMIIDFKKITDFLGWKKFNIIGHSLGGEFALQFASLFPESVEKLVVLDIVKPSSRATNMFPKEIIETIKRHFQNEKKMSNPPPIYTQESAAERLKKGMYDEITKESAQILIKRGTRLSDCGTGFIFSRDIRCRTLEEFGRISHELTKQYMSHVFCELLIILAKNTHPYYQTKTPEVIDDFLEIYRKNCKNFLLQKVEGNHFVHLNNPERVAPLINDFLLCTNNLMCFK